MRQVKPNHRGERGQAIVEGALVLIVFIALMVGALDFGQMLFFHQGLVERVRDAVRWGSINQYDGTGDKIANMVLYGTPTPADPPGPSFLGLRRENVDIAHFNGTSANPNDERITVTIRNYRYNFFSPWIAGTYVSANPVSESAPVFYRP